MKIKYILTLIWYNIKSKKKSAISLFVGFLFVVLLIQAFLVYTTILDNEYEKIEKNDSDNYAIVYEDLDQGDIEFINGFEETEHIVSSSRIEILNYKHNTSMIVLNSNTYHYEDVSALKKLSVYHYIFKKNSEIFTSYELNKYDVDVLHSGRYPHSSDEIVISINMLDYYGLEPEEVLDQYITLTDGTHILVEDLYVSGLLNDNYQRDRADLPYNIFEIITYHDETRITEITDEFTVDVYAYSEVYFNTYLNINETIDALYDYFTGDLSVWYGGQANADMVVLLVNQSLFAKEMFALIGSILIFAMLISLMVSIIFRIKNQAIYISISHVYG
ncbi:MAG: hypothetical protein RBT45_02875, partial [Acholeplasmataceae bacterium]|nr:hypothetical protein [Acholeplasmataceae bacterium]